MRSANNCDESTKSSERNNPRATAAAIDRVVHHSIILEFDVPSYRTGAAQQRGETTAAEASTAPAEEVSRQNQLTPDRQKYLMRNTLGVLAEIDCLNTAGKTTPAFGE